jgi:hypothetical protein
MEGLHGPAEDILRPAIAGLGYDLSRFGVATDLEHLGDRSPMMVWVTTKHRNDDSFIRLIADKIAHEYELSTSSKKGGNKRITFVHQFRVGQRVFMPNEVSKVLQRLLAAQERFESTIDLMADEAIRHVYPAHLPVAPEPA